MATTVSPSSRQILTSPKPLKQVVGVTYDDDDDSEDDKGKNGLRPRALGFLAKNRSR